MVVQTFFFIFIASKQYENVLADKMNIVSRYVNKNETVKQNFRELKSEYLKKSGSAAKKQYDERQVQNKSLINKFCVLPIAVALAVLMYVIFVMGSKNPWNNIDSLNLVLVLLAYATELYFFFFVVRKYEFVGDHYIFSNIFKAANS
jgi:Na+/glutamate symporter